MKIINNKKTNNIFVICPTYRGKNNDSKLRFIGIIYLVEQIKKQSYLTNSNIKLAIVDSSSEPHPYFINNNSIDQNFVLYLHIPNRNTINNNITKDFPLSCSFLPNDKDLKSVKWKKIVKHSMDWDKFFPWESDYPKATVIKKQIYNDRPSIGMKRNFAISALTEKFGEADYIVYADDDDIRNTNYIQNLMNGIGDYSFARMFKYYTYNFYKDKSNSWGIYDVKFTKDSNGNWTLNKYYKNNYIYNDNKKVQYKFKKLSDKYSNLISLAFSPIASSGALHCFKYNLWKNSINEFGGIPITSTCEDHIFFINCQRLFGLSFTSTYIDVDKPCFIRTSDGLNSSLIEYTNQISESDVDNWAINYINKYNILLNKTYDSIVDIAKSKNNNV